MSTLYEQGPSSEIISSNNKFENEEILDNLHNSSLSTADLQSTVLIDSLKEQSVSEVRKSFIDGLLTQYFSDDKLPSLSKISANSDTIITNSLILLGLNNSTKYNQEGIPDVNGHTISEWTPFLTNGKCKFLQNVVGAKPDGKFGAQSLLLVINALGGDVSNYVGKLSNSYKVDSSVLVSHKLIDDESSDVFVENIDSGVVEIFGRYNLSFDKSLVKSIKHNEKANTITVSTNDGSTILSFDAKNGGIKYTNHELFSLTKEGNDAYKLSSRKESFDANKIIFDEFSINYDSSDIDSFDYNYEKGCYILSSGSKSCKLKRDEETNSITLSDNKYFHLSRSGNDKKNLYLWTGEGSDDVVNDGKNSGDGTNEVFDSEISQISDDIAYDGVGDLLTIPDYKSYNKLSTDLVGGLIDRECRKQHGKAERHSGYHIGHDDCLSEMSKGKFKYNDKNGNIEYTNTSDGKNINIFIRKMKTEDGSKYFISEKGIDGLACGFDDLSEAINTLKLIEYIKIRFDGVETGANTGNSNYDTCTSNSSPFFIGDEALYFSTDRGSIGGLIGAYDDENIVSTGNFGKISKVFRKYNHRVELAKYLVNSVSYDEEH